MEVKNADRKKGILSELLYLAVVCGALSLWMWERGSNSLILLVGCNLLAVLSARWTAEGIFGSRMIGRLGGVLFAFVPYRFYSLSLNRDYAEGIAWALLPLLWGCGYLLLGERHTKERSRVKSGFTATRNVRRNAAGGCGVTAACALLFVLGVSVINLWEWKQDAGLFLAGEIFWEEGTTLQGQGMYPVHYLMTYVAEGSSTDFGAMGMVEAAPVGIGILLTAGVLCYLWLWLIGKIRAGENLFFQGMLFLGLFAAWCSTNVFAWDDLKWNDTWYRWAAFLIQKPTRLVGIVTVCFWLVACRALTVLTDWRLQKIAMPEVQSGTARIVAAENEGNSQI